MFLAQQAAAQRKLAISCIDSSIDRFPFRWIRPSVPNFIRTGTTIQVNLISMAACLVDNEAMNLKFFISPLCFGQRRRLLSPEGWIFVVCMTFVRNKGKCLTKIAETPPDGLDRNLVANRQMAYWLCQRENPYFDEILLRRVTSYPSAFRYRHSNDMLLVTGCFDETKLGFDKTPNFSHD